MGESTKAILALFLIIGFIASPLVWMTDNPTTLIWSSRIGFPLLSVVSLILILLLHARRDLKRDYLKDQFGTYFNRDGFCFVLSPSVIDDIMYFDAWFQSQYDQRSIGQIALRPSRGFFLNRASIDTIVYYIECPPAGFGVTRIAVPVPLMLQGKKQAFEIDASVTYPDGKGQRVRFHDGVFLRSNTNFGSAVNTAIVVAGALTGQFVFSNPATIKLTIPIGVVEGLPQQIPPQTEIFSQSMSLV